MSSEYRITLTVKDGHESEGYNWHVDADSEAGACTDAMSLARKYPGCHVSVESRRIHRHIDLPGASPWQPKHHFGK